LITGLILTRDQTGVYDLAKEGGHSEHRVLHYKDVTGYEIESVLLKQIHENEEHRDINTLLLFGVDYSASSWASMWIKEF
jgi:aspartate oxidase